MQPYRRQSTIDIKTSLQTFAVMESDKNKPVNWQKQSSAFPPNFVHSLDASHMMLSAVACHSKNISFAAVHDSYWTHPSDVDDMSRLLREAFIQLHSQDIMQRLEREFYTRYGEMRVPTTIVIKDPQQIQVWNEYLVKNGRKGTKTKSKTIKTYVKFSLPPLPKRGDFNVEMIRNSTYFFH